MIIDQSAMVLASRHQASQTQSSSQSLRMWVGNPPGRNAGQGTTAAGDQVSLSAQALSAAQEQQNAQTLEEASSLEPRLAVLKALLEALTGHEINVTDLSKFDKESHGNGHAHGHGHAPGQQQTQRAGFGLEYEEVQRYEESETMEFSAAGVVKTADGRQIEISLDLSMSRQFVEENRLSIRAGDALLTDPLVINFDGNAAQLTQTRFEFDLNADGQTEEIPFVQAGSGLLALDRNGDGTVNDGTELFGPQTGQGMEELAALDDDGNGWIDERDEAYSQLRVWTKDAQGTDRLQTLKQAGVGAIYLENMSTPFALKDASNTLQGQVRSTGVYLNENGSAGTIQQLDLAV